MFLFAEQKQNTFVTAVTNFTSKVIKRVFYIYSTPSYHRFASDLWFLCGMIEVRSILSISVSTVRLTILSYRDNAVLLHVRTHN